jgi:hypothetical protein
MYEYEVLTRKDVKDLQLSALFYDKLYQRPLVQTMINRIYKDFDPRLLATIIVSEREDGRYAILDGNHRVAAAKKAGLTSISCVVHKNLTVEQEAKMFSDLNQVRKKVPLWEIHKARILYGAPDSLFIDRIFKECNLEVVAGSKGQKGKTKTGVISALEPVYSLHGAVRLGVISEIEFKEVISFVAELCASANSPVDREILKGVCYLARRGFFKRYLDLKSRLFKRGLDKIHTYIRSAQIDSLSTGYGERVLAIGILKCYNQGLPTEKQAHIDA